MSSSNDAVSNKAFLAATDERDIQWKLINEKLIRVKTSGFPQTVVDGILLPENAARLTMEGYDVVVVINGKLEECRYIISWFLAEKDRIGCCVVHAYEPFIEEQYKEAVNRIHPNPSIFGGDLPGGFIG